MTIVGQGSFIHDSRPGGQQIVTEYPGDDNQELHSQPLNT